MPKSDNLKPFEPGRSGNPGGRPRVPDDVKRLARGYTTEAIETLASVMRDAACPAAARVSAASTILDRAWGKPPQHITTESLESLPDDELRAELAAAYAELRHHGFDPEGEGAPRGDAAPPRTH